MYSGPVTDSTHDKKGFTFIPTIKTVKSDPDLANTRVIIFRN
jgi:hypothetical protein